MAMFLRWRDYVFAPLHLRITLPLVIRSFSLGLFDMLTPDAGGATKVAPPDICGTRHFALIYKASLVRLAPLCHRTSQGSHFSAAGLPR
jgi:hypothetical protein